MIPLNVETISNDSVSNDGHSVPYEAFVCQLVKERGTAEANLEHMLIGVGGEVGELMDCIKRHTIYGKPLDRTNAIEELGDIEFYLAGLRQMLGIERQETLQQNAVKLWNRYPTGSYSDQQAQERADKQPQQDTRPDLHVIDVTKPQPTTLSAEQVAAVDDTAGLAPAK